MPVSETVVGLDLGTTKITAIIVEVSEAAEMRVVGVGTTKSPGMRSGTVVDIEQTTDAIREAVDLAEQMAGSKVREVYVGIAGDHIRSINSRGVIAVSRTQQVGYGNLISQFDKERVIERAREVALPSDREVLHVLPQHFTVDNETNIREPVGMTGMRLEADVHIITGARSSSQNIYHCIKGAGMHLKELVLEPLASSYAVLDEDEKDLGVALIDIGGGTTDIVVFLEGSIRHTAVIGVGGESVTRDIAKVIGIATESAEKLKLEKGGVFPPLPETLPINVPQHGERRAMQVDPAELNAVINARMDEIFRLVVRELKRVDLLDKLSAGIVLTGGASLLRGTTKLAEDIFRKPVRIGIPRGLNGLADTIQSPAHATGVGLVLYALREGSAATDSQTTRPSRGAFSGLFNSLRSIFEGLVT